MGCVSRSWRQAEQTAAFRVRGLKLPFRIRPALAIRSPARRSEKGRVRRFGASDPATAALGGEPTVCRLAGVGEQTFLSRTADWQLPTQSPYFRRARSGLGGCSSWITAIETRRWAAGRRSVRSGVGRFAGSTKRSLPPCVGCYTISFRNRPELSFLPEPAAMQRR